MIITKFSIGSLKTDIRYDVEVRGRVPLSLDHRDRISDRRLVFDASVNCVSHEGDYEVDATVIVDFDSNLGWLEVLGVVLLDFNLNSIIRMPLTSEEYNGVSEENFFKGLAAIVTNSEADALKTILEAIPVPDPALGCVLKGVGVAVAVGALECAIKTEFPPASSRDEELSSDRRDFFARGREVFAQVKQVFSCMRRGGAKITNNALRVTFRCMLTLGLG